MDLQKFFQVAQAGADAILILLVGFSVISLAMIFERYFTLRRIKIQSRKVSDRIKDMLAENNVEHLEELSKDRDSLEGRVLGYAMRHTKAHGERGLEEVFNSFTLLERPALERNMGFLATAASTSPLIGLLGTVLGIMKAFDDLSEAAGKNEAVLSGIAHALTATAVGLLVAIPANMAFNYFQKQIKSILQNLEAVKELSLSYAKSRTPKA